jgi:hypothetical protein
MLAFLAVSRVGTQRDANEAVIIVAGAQRNPELLRVHKFMSFRALISV